MKCIINIFVLLPVLVMTTVAGAVDLSGSAAVNVTSDTAATAKNMALDEARRQIIIDVLSPYSEPAQLHVAVKNASASDLMPLIATSSIDGEQLSDTTYSANISMTVDGVAARRWMTDANVQNWLPTDTSGDKFVVIATLGDRMSGWMDLNRIARAEKIDLDTKQITGPQVMFELPTANRASFTIALRDAGWRYSDTDGALRIWK